MLLRITLVLEILAVIICIHSIYGEKVKLDIDTIALFLAMLSVLEIINHFNIKNISSLIVYVFIWIYCKIKFKETAARATVHFVIFLILFIILQFVSVLFVNLFLPHSEIWRAFITNFLMLLFCLLVLPRLKVFRIYRFVNRYYKLMYIVIGMAFFILSVLLFQNKIEEKIKAEYFVFAIPAIALLLFMIIKWGNAQSKAENLEKEKQAALTGQKKYDELLEQVRLRQHEFKNHVTAIFSAHYAYDTYENIKKARETYYGKIQTENRYNGLLLLDNHIISGFLYGKFEEMEQDGLQIRFKSAICLRNCDVPDYKLIEMTGILLDNAAETMVKSAETEKVISISMEEGKSEWLFKIRNKFRYVPYDEIEAWFQFEKSGNGMGRGIGLYHLKMLCAEWNCGILCRNNEDAGHNEIEFVLSLPKAESP